MKISGEFKNFIKKVFFVTIIILNMGFFVPSTIFATPFGVFSVIPSRVEVSVTDVNFLIKFRVESTVTENEIRVTFGTGYAVDGTPANITTSVAGLTSWDAACTSSPTITGNAANAVAGLQVDFTSNDLTPATVYCFLITAGIDNPGSPGNYNITVATLQGSNVVSDDGIFTLPVVDDDEVVITATVQAYVTCDVTTTTGSDNSINLGSLTYGSLTTSTDDIQVTGGTNGASGMLFYYKSSNAAGNPGSGLYNASYLLDAPTAEDTISATTIDCTVTDPCYGIYRNATGITTTTGTVTANADFTGGGANDVGPMTTSLFGNVIATSSAPTTGAVVEFDVKATASQLAPAATYTDTLIFTCSANI